MLSHDMKESIILGLLICFLTAWVYTEIAEHIERGYFQEDLKKFVSKGARFTAEDGYIVCQRIRNLEMRAYPNVEIPPCKHPDDE